MDQKEKINNNWINDNKLQEELHDKTERELSNSDPAKSNYGTLLKNLKTSTGIFIKKLNYDTNSRI
jgi:hypothetical protein